MRSGVIVLPGEPHPQPRHRTRICGIDRKGNQLPGKKIFTTEYEEAKHKKWKEDVKVLMAMPGIWFPSGAQVFLTIYAWFECPAGDHRKTMEVPARWHAKRGDVDNIAKAIMDAAKTILWHDDGQVVAGITYKGIAPQHERPMTVIHLEEMQADPMAAYVRSLEIAVEAYPPVAGIKTALDKYGAATQDGFLDLAS